MHECLTYLETSRGLSAHTLTATRQDLEKWEGFLQAEGLEVLGVSKPQASAFLAGLRKRGLSPLTVNRIASSLRGFYRYLLKAGLSRENPFGQIRNLKAGRRLPALLRSQDLESLLASPGEKFLEIRNQLIFELLYSTGCRASELLSLNVKGILGDQVRVRGKGNKERLVFLTREAQKALENYLPQRNLVAKDCEALLVNSRGQRLGTMGLSLILNRALKKSGIWQKATPHTFRHTFATHLLDQGLDIRHLQEMLGHSQLSTTQIYTHLSLEKLRSALEQAHPHGGRK